MNSNAAEDFDIVEVMERNRARQAEQVDDVVVMFSNARRAKREHARRVAEEAARKTMKEAEDRHDQRVNDPDVFVKLLMDKPIRVQVVNAPVQKKSSGIESYIGSMFTGLFAGIAAVLAAMVAAGVL